MAQNIQTILLWKHEAFFFLVSVVFLRGVITRSEQNIITWAYLTFIVKIGILNNKFCRKMTTETKKIKKNRIFRKVF